MTNPKIKQITSQSYITGIQTITSSIAITSTRRSLDSFSYIVEPKTTILCDGEIVDDIVNEFGTNIVLRVVTKTIVDSDDPYAMATISNTDYNKIALAQRYTASDDEVKEGVFKAGEIIFVFKPEDNNYVNSGNQILYSGKWFEISSVSRHQRQDTIYRIEARVKAV